MVKFDPSLSLWEKTWILFSVVPKVVRGLLFSLKSRNSRGPIFIGKHVDILNASRISCGKNVKFESYSEVQGLSKHGLIFGDNVTIGRGTMIRPSSYYGGDCGYGLVMGDGSSVGPHGYIGCSGPVIIGKNTMLGPKCSIFAENHIFSDGSVPIKEQGVSNAGVRIGDNCWIGSNVVIVDGVKIGHGCVIGASAVVTHDVPDNSVLIDKRKRAVRPRIGDAERLGKDE